MAADYVPASDGDLSAWAGRFSAAAAANATALGLLPADLTAVDAAVAAFSESIGAYQTAQAEAQTRRATKDDARDVLEALIRPLVRRIQAAPGCTDTLRASLEITIPDRTPTSTQGQTPATRPIAAVDTSQRLRHEIRFWDESTPTSRRKPAGAMGCEIWMKVDGTAPAGPNDVQFVALDTASPYTFEHEASAAGKTAYYMLRWTLKSGAKGPWSETVAATVTG